MAGTDRVTPALPATGEPFAAVAETHSAVVFFAGDRAYKLNRRFAPMSISA